jgi:hypothetical protein
LDICWFLDIPPNFGAIMGQKHLVRLKNVVWRNALKGEPVFKNRGADFVEFGNKHGYPGWKGFICCARGYVGPDKGGGLLITRG